MVSELYTLPLLAVAAVLLPWLVWRRASPRRLPLTFTWVSATIVSVAVGYAALWTAARANVLVHGPFWFWLFAAVAMIAQIAARRAARGELATAAASEGGLWRALNGTAVAEHRWLFGALLATLAAIAALDLAALALALVDRGMSWLAVAPIAAVNSLPYLAARRGLSLLLLAGALIAGVYVVRARGRRAAALACGLGVIIGAVKGPSLLWQVVPAPGGITLWLHAAGAFTGLVAALALHASGGLVVAPDRGPVPALPKGAKEPMVVRKAQRDLAIAAAVLVASAAVIGWRPVPGGFAWPIRLLGLAWVAVFPAAVLLACGPRRVSMLQLQFARVLACAVASLIAFALVWPDNSVPFIGAMQLFYVAPIAALLLVVALITHVHAARSIGRAALFFSPYARSRGTGLGLSYVVLYCATLHQVVGRLIGRVWILLH